MDSFSSKQILQKIFEYDDYRVFLRDYFEAKKTENSHFSQRSFTERVGFNAHNFCTLVVQGKRNLSTTSIQKLVNGLGLRGKAATFFENLVYLNQADTLQDREFYFQRIKKIGRLTQFYQLNQDQFFFYEKWYYPVIRELMVVGDWKGDYSALAKMVRPAIAPSEARESVERLVATGMVVKGEDGKYRLANQFVTSENVPVYIKKKSRRDVLLKGIDAIDTIGPEKKYAAYSTVTMSKKLFSEAKALLNETREKLLSMVAEDGPAEEVYEVVLQAFPVSALNDRQPSASGEKAHEL
jgi:uncharacterized protein (TIGR02147 family)